MFGQYAVPINEIGKSGCVVMFIHENARITSVRSDSGFLVLNYFADSLSSMVVAHLHILGNQSMSDGFVEELENATHIGDVMTDAGNVSVWKIEILPTNDPLTEFAVEHAKWCFSLIPGSTDFNPNLN